MHPPAAARKGRHAEPAMSRTAPVARRRAQGETDRAGAGPAGPHRDDRAHRIGPHRGGPGPSRPRGPTNLTTPASRRGAPPL